MVKTLIATPDPPERPRKAFVINDTIGTTTITVSVAMPTWSTFTRPIALPAGKPPTS
jgi:hypothetical protein